MFQVARRQIHLSNAYPSAGGIGMILNQVYGPTTVAAGAALLMALSMVINESLVARTFGTNTLRAFGGDPDSVLSPILGVGLIVFAYLVNASGTHLDVGVGAEGGHDGADDEREREARPGELGDLAGQREDARADHHAGPLAIAPGSVMLFFS